MPKQVGVIKISGLLGDLSFYKSKYGFIMRSRTGVDGKRIKRDPSFRRTRENSQEFAHAAKSGKLLRVALKKTLAKCGDSNVYRRLLKTMIKILQTDPINERGKRRVASGDIQLLNNFEFNISTPLSRVVNFPFNTHIYRSSGEAGLMLPSFSPEKDIHIPGGATHFRFLCNAAEIDFEKGKFHNEEMQTAWLSVSDERIDELSLSPGITPESKKKVILSLAIEFGQEINENFYPFQNQKANAMCVVGVG